MPGFFTPGFPKVGSATYPVLTGGESIPADTSFNEPATVSLTPFQLAVFAASLIENIATASAGAATLNTEAGIINTGAETTAAGGTFQVVITNNTVTANSNVFAQVYPGTATAGQAEIKSVTTSANTITVVVANVGSAAFNGTFLIGFHQPQSNIA
jgi:hypothetical protein